MLFDSDTGTITQLQTIDTTVAPPSGQRNTLTIVGTGGLVLPSGTTAERPEFAAPGTQRWNTTINAKEVFDGTNWTSSVANSGNQTIDGALTVTSLDVGTSDTIGSGSSLTPAGLFGIKSVSADDTEPRDLSFSADGTKMYVLGNAGDDITQYTLSTPWRVSTAASPTTFSVVGQDAAMQGLYVKPDGSGFYTCGAGDSVHQYSMTAGDITTASWVRSLSVTAYETDPQAVEFKPDGTRMYVIGTTGDDVNQFNLSTPWDISTAVHNSVFLVNNAITGETTPQGLAFNSDGTSMWVVGPTYRRVSVYTLGTPWEVSSSTFSEAIPIIYTASPTDDTTLYTMDGVSGIFVNETQRRIYVSDYNHDSIFEFNMGPSLVVSGNSFGVRTKQFYVWGDTNINGRVWLGSGFLATGNGVISGTLTCNTLTASASNTTHNIGTGITSGTVNLGTGQSSGLVNIGGATATGTLNVGRSTATNTVNFAAGATANGATKTVNLGTGGVAGSTTTINFGSSNGTVTFTFLGTTLTFNGNTVWHGGNDGATSGLDADLLDGQHGSYYLPAAHAGSGDTAHATATTSVSGFLSASDKFKLDGIAAGATARTVYEFTSSQTWTVSGDWILIEVWGAGGGGGSGSQGATATNRTGGAGGGGGGYAVKLYQRAELPATLNVGIGAGGSGGSSRTTDNTFGMNGTNGGASYVYAVEYYVVGYGGIGGIGGSGSATNTGGEGGLFLFNISTYASGNSTNSIGFSYGVGVAGSSGGHGGYGGGAGGGATTAVATSSDGGCSINGGGGGGAGGSLATDNRGSLCGAGGTVLGGQSALGVQNSGRMSGTNTTPGTAGADGVTLGSGGAGGGPGGGGSGAGGAGGAGAPAGGGGGGGASVNGNASGAGGAGGNGFCRITTW